MKKPKLIRITTVPLSLEKLLENQARFMSADFEVVLVSSDAERLARVGQHQGVRTFCVEMTRKITPLKDVLSLWQMYRFLKREKPEIVHSHTPKAGIIGMLAARLAGVPIRMHTVAGLPLLEATGIKRKVLDFVESLTYAAATLVLPNSHGLCRIIQQNGYCKAGKLRVLGNGSSNGIDTDHFSPDHFTDSQRGELKSEFGISPSDFVFIFVGRIVRDKGIDEAVNAFVSINRDFPRTKFLLVGDFEPDLDPVSGVTMAAIKDHPGIISAGFRADVRPFLAISDALVFPSYREGFPNVVMQAGAMELPAIVSDINGCNEIVEEGKNGLIIPVKHADAVRLAMQTMVSDAPLFHGMRQNARPMIVERYGQKFIWEALRREYCEQLKDV